MSQRRTVEEFVSLWFGLHPQRATEKGYSGYDHTVPDYSQQTVDRFLSRFEELESSLASSPSSRLEFEADLLRSHLAGARRPFKTGALETSPTFYLQAGLDSLESVRLRFAEPWPMLVGRLGGLAHLLQTARSQLRGVCSTSAEIALEMSRNASEELGQNLVRGHCPTAVAEQADLARRELDGFSTWLQEQELAQFQPMGGEAYSDLLRSVHLLESDWPEWESRARKALREVTEQLACLPLTEPPTQGGGLSREEAWAYFESELERVRALVESANLVTILEGELKLCQTPAYLEALIPGAHYLEPAVFAGEKIGRFFLPPLAQEWTPQVQRRYAWRQSRGGFANLVAHEAWPGHHLQFLHAAHHHRPLHSVCDNDVMLEGWALYCEGLMERHGLHAVSPFRPRLEALRLRIVRVLVDIGLHTGGMTMVQAESFMGKELGAEGSSWVRSEIRRYALEPGQAMSYWVGATMIEELRQELEVCPEKERDFHDQLLSYGAVPLPLICRRLKRRPRQFRRRRIPAAKGAPDIGPVVQDPRSAHDLFADLEAMERSPLDLGRVEGIVVRPGENLRQLRDCVRVSPEGGVEGDSWSRGCWLQLPDGRPHPSVQVAVMNSRVINLMAGERAYWPLAGDNLYLDFDLSQANLQPGQRLRIGSALFEVTDEPHLGCKKFALRYGAGAVRFVNSPRGRELRLRGIYLRVIQAGEVSLGDRVEKI